MQVLYYVLLGLFGMLGGWFVISGLSGRPPLGATPVMLARVVLALAAGWSILMLRWAYRLGEGEGRWAAGLGAIGAAVAGFYGLQMLGMVVGMIVAAARPE